VAKRGLGIDVLTAARQRIARVFDDFPCIYVSFSGGKDSGVMLELVAAEARARGRRVGVMVIDLEAQYKLTIDYIQQTLERHADVVDPYWVCLPLSLRNAVSQFEPQWRCWEPGREQDWVRQPPEGAIADEGLFPFFSRGMEFEDFTPEFAHWYGQGKLTACFVGIRTDESLNRYRTIASKGKGTFEGWQWTTWTGGPTYNVYPIYDWRTEDIWTFYGREHVPYNRLYDRMHQAGLTIHQARICQPYGDDQRKGLWLYHVIEPETWARVVARVNGANFGATTSTMKGNVNGTIKVTRPDGITWKEFAERLLESMPTPIAEHYRNKIHRFLEWYDTRGYPDGAIPDEGSATDTNLPSWTRICKMLLRNDYWAKGLSFSQHRTGAYERYRDLMLRKRAKRSFM
jgi:predicted phosphoadenosine phosphosulfate sulfurtransferase